MTNWQATAELAKLPPLVDSFTGRKVLLVGDLVADHYIKGKSSRLSREAPVIILKYQEEYVVPGQVGNTAANIAALGGQAMLVGVVGSDARGQQLCDALSDSGVDLAGIVKSEGGATLTKTRLLAGGHHTARQQVIRIDDDERLTPTDKDRRAIHAAMRRAGRHADAVIVSDYGYGVIDEPTWQLALDIATTRSIPLVLDSRYSLTQWKGATLITPNEEEAVAAAGLAGTCGYNIVEVGKKIRRLSQCQNLIITRGNEGMILFTGKGQPTQLPIFGSDECTDVTGAGDTVVATSTLALAAGAKPAQAMVLSNLAGSIVVMKMGTATLTQEEMHAGFEMIPTAG